MYQFVYENNDFTTDTLNCNNVKIVYTISSQDVTVTDMVQHFETWLRSVGYVLDNKMIDIVDR